jgi:aminoglycoside 6-adenylyltransferase
MRTPAAIKKLILDIATADERIRAVLLNGSRADATIAPDTYQDFDIVFIVDNIQSFTNNHEWTNIFGEKIIQQLPQEMCFGNDKDSAAFPYLMLFKDGNRIDLTLFPKEKTATDFIAESLTVVWLDKDHLFAQLPAASNSDHFVKRPSHKEFTDTCNEFWWVSTYVVKGLLRNQVTYAKEMMETVMRPMFMKLIEWKIGAENNFEVSVGKACKYMQQYLQASDYEKILHTYADHDLQNNWKSFFSMTELFSRFANEVAGKLKFLYNTQEEQNTIKYLEHLHNEENQK